jgi:chromosome segregation ATPase
MSIAADHMRMRERAQVELRDAENRRNYALERIEGLERTITTLDRRIRDDEAARYGLAAKRRASASRARRLLATSRQAATFQRQRADVLAAQLDKLRADMADPIQPERASDIARLVRERDEARNAAAATSARNASLQAALNSLGDKLEAMAVKVTLAERAARVAPPIAV